VPGAARSAEDGRVLIRREEPADVEVIRAIVAASFTRPGDVDPVPAEVTLLDELRADDSWLPALSLVAVEPHGDEVVGHVVCTRAWAGGRPALGLGPLAVRPDRQRRGVGSALMHAVLAAADALDEPLVALVGDPAYYGRFGFRPATEYGIEPPNPEWGPYFQVRTLSAHQGQTGIFAYAPPFNRL
jgi:putative acetyltransferase